MTFVADESVDQAIIDRLRRDGHAVAAVATDAPSTADAAVLQLAVTGRVVLITGDQDFGELVFRDGRSAVGVILLRLAGVTPPTKAAIVSQVVADFGERLVGAFLVAEPGRVRTRLLPTPAPESP